MKLLTLKLENFQGFKLKEFTFGGQNASIFGDNATGKTTVFNAVTYLLFDKASTGAKNFTPKTKGKDGDLHYLDHSVEASFKMDDGRIVTLKKVFHENYKKKRGSAVEEFDGHSVDCFVDGVPTKEKDYQATLLSFCGSIDKMKILTMPHYFPEELGWEARRKILLEICGDITDEDVIKANPNLVELSKFLLMPGTTNQYYSVDEYKKIAGAQKTSINKQIQDIPGRIDEAQRAIPDITGISEAEVIKEIQRLNTEKSQLETEKAQLLSGDTTSLAIRQKISQANTELEEAKAKYIAEHNQLNEGVYAAIDNLKQEQMTIKNLLLDNKNKLRREKEALETMNQTRARLIKQYEVVSQNIWDEENEICPTCHRPLPAEEIAKAKEEFNLGKSKHLESINRQGQQEASKEMIQTKQTEIKELEEKILADEKKIQDLADQIISLREKNKEVNPFESTAEYTAIIAKIDSLKEQETQNKDNFVNKVVENINQGIQELQEQIQEKESERTKFAIAASQKERIAELEATEKDLSQQFEKLQQGIYLCEMFVKSKVSMLTDKINSKFQSVRYRLFIEQQNGGVKEDCEVMIPNEDGSLVPYAFANNAARINAGLEIIDTISKHWNLSMPVFVDNAESITKLRKIDSQVIRLVVSEQDPKLRLVV